MATQAICPNPGPVPLQELTGPAVLASPFRPIIQSRQESYVLYELYMPFNIVHLCRGLESSCYYPGNSGPVAFCVSPTSLFCGAPGSQVLRGSTISKLDWGAGTRVRYYRCRDHKPFSEH